MSDPVSDKSFLWIFTFKFNNTWKYWRGQTKME